MKTLYDAFFRISAFWIITSLQPLPLSAQQDFHVVFWPEQGGLLASAEDRDQWKTKLETHWYDRHLPSMLSEPLRLHPPLSSSLQDYQQLIRKLQPQCIEGDPVYVERVINLEASRIYIPVLQSKESLDGEIIFRSTAPDWNGTLGVVHENYSVGGWLQTRYWQEQSSQTPGVYSFHSTQEVLMHLMIGSIDAAAVPQGALDRFLQQHDRSDLAQRLHRITVPNPLPPVMIFLRQDRYDRVFQRILVSESWLRDLLSNRLSMVPQPIGFLSLMHPLQSSP